jgi:hypothetical protein
MKSDIKPIRTKKDYEVALKEKRCGVPSRGPPGATGSM